MVLCILLEPDEGNSMVYCFLRRIGNFTGVWIFFCRIIERVFDKPDDGE